MIRPAIEKWYKENAEKTDAFARYLWENPEEGHHEFKSCRANADFLRAEGFEVKTFNARGDDAPDTAIIATFGHGHPVVGIYGEYDALPGLGQNDVPYRSEKEGFGHGCGHNLMAAGCTSAVCAVKAAMEAENLPGTIVYLGCPAEEGGCGKMYMLEDGYFDMLDCLLGWHPRTNDLALGEKLQMTMGHAVIEFHGVSAHAAVAPEKGRSALDACELMNVGVQYLREHCTSDVRIHYSYLAAGEKPNVVPRYAALDYYFRSKDLKSCHELMERIKKVAYGAAMMTETECVFNVNYIHSGCQPLSSMNEIMYNALLKMPPLEYTKEEYDYADKLFEAFDGTKPDKELTSLPTKIEKPRGEFYFAAGSTDVGCVTYKIPTARIFGLGMCRNVAMHSWGAVATAGNSIGFKAARYAGAALAECACDILAQPEKISVFKDELKRRLEGKFTTQIFPKKKNAK
ncbi:MAG: amidohydrolase [Clostridia bacterium]|nr:amidohydrolase [Clostridia bacterium]